MLVCADVLHFGACKSCEITPTVFVEWTPIVYEGGEALGVLAEALPSGDGGGHLVDTWWRTTTCTWGKPLSYP